MGYCCRSFKSADTDTIDLILHNVCLKGAQTLVFTKRYYKEESRWK